MSSGTHNRERGCYNRHLRGQSWRDIGAHFWGEETPPADWAGTAGQWHTLKASCAASRHAGRYGVPWPIRRGSGGAE